MHDRDDIAEVANGRQAQEQKLAAALQRVDKLRKLNLDLRIEKAFLRGALAKANRLACYDELTGLPNRHLLQDHFNQAVARAAGGESEVGLRV